MRTLVIEDNPGDFGLLQAMLEDAGADLQLVRAGRLDEALERLGEGAFDLALLDLSLPDSHGLRSVDALVVSAPALPVIVLTGRADDDLALEAMHHGAQDYLVKGRFDGGLLLRVVRHAVERKRAEEAARSLTIEKIARGQAEAAEKRARFLADAAAVLASCLDSERALEELARIAVPMLGDWCAVHVRDPNGGLRLLAARHPDPAMEELLHEMGARFPPGPDHVAARVLEGAEAQLLLEVPAKLVEQNTRNAEHFTMAQRLGMRTAIVVPIVGRGGVHAVMSIASSQASRRHTRGDLATAKELGERAALAIENAALFAAERRARRLAEIAAERTTRLQLVTAALSGAATPAEVAKVAVEHGVSATGAATGGLWMCEPDGHRARLVKSVGFDDRIISTFGHMDLHAPLPGAEALERGQAVWVESRAQFDAEYPEVAPPGEPAAAPHAPLALACLPLITGERRLGLLAFRWRQDRPFDCDEQRFLLTLAQHCAEALERARLYQEAQVADERKDEFLAMLGHELRNPLAAMNNGLSLARMMGVGEKADRPLGMVERQVRNMSRLVDDLLDVARITRGKIELAKQRLEVAGAVSRAVETLKPLADAREHALSLDVEHGLFIDADPVRIEQIVANLLNNAIKYTPRRGRIAVSCLGHGEFVVIHVRDSGVGLTADVLPHVFEPFMQARRSLDRAQGGLGIGLTLVKRLAELHGGTVGVSSAGPDLGSDFWARFPLAAAETQAVPEHPEGGARPAAALLDILVVDDNVDAAESLAEILALSDHTVRVAHGGDEALRLACERVPELVFLDIGLPGRDGFEVVRALRSRPGFERTRFVAVSGYGQAEDRLRSAAAGFHAHLVKPVSLAHVDAEVAQRVGERRAEDHGIPVARAG